MPFKVVRFVISPYTVFGIRVPFIQSLARNESKQQQKLKYNNIVAQQGVSKISHVTS